MTWRLHIVQALPSTQDTCAALAQAGEAHGLALMARKQTAGRGTRGRRWLDAPGNLALSFLLRPGQGCGGSPGQVGQWALLAGLALHEALAGHAGVGRLSLKWPNDVLLDGRKLAGVRVDAETDGAGALAWLVIGTGANLSSCPDLPGAASLGARPDPVAVARTVLCQVGHWAGVLRDAGFDPVRHAWLARAHSLGTVLQVRGAGHDVSGRFAGLAADGALLIATADRVLALNTGEVLQAEG